jgi:hypothetical protein
MALTTTLPIWIALVALGLLVGVMLWANQRETVLQAAEVRAGSAEARAATAEAIVTAQASMEAATATARAYANSPQAAVQRSLEVVLAAEREPNDQHLRALNDALGPGALGMVRPEVEHLLSGALHLSGQSGFELDVQDTAFPTDDTALVRTHERWTYDERNGDDQRMRCLVETSDQTYSLQQSGSDWKVNDIELSGSTRTDCTSP